MTSSLNWRQTAKPDAEYTVRTRCPQCGRKHITVFRLRHVSDSFFVQLGHFFRYARHFDFQRLRWCTNSGQDRKSTRLNSSHMSISYAVFCLKKKKKKTIPLHTQNNT